MKDYAHLLEDDPDYAEKAKRFSSKVKDVMEFIAEQKPELNFNLSFRRSHRLRNLFNNSNRFLPLVEMTDSE